MASEHVCDDLYSVLVRFSASGVQMDGTAVSVFRSRCVEIAYGTGDDPRRRRATLEEGKMMTHGAPDRVLVLLAQ